MPIILSKKKEILVYKFDQQELNTLVIATADINHSMRDYKTWFENETTRKIDKTILQRIFPAFQFPKKLLTEINWHENFEYEQLGEIIQDILNFSSIDIPKPTSFTSDLIETIKTRTSDIEDTLSYAHFLLHRAQFSEVVHEGLHQGTTIRNPLYENDWTEVVGEKRVVIRVAVEDLRKASIDFSGIDDNASAEARDELIPHIEALLVFLEKKKRAPPKEIPKDLVDNAQRHAKVLTDKALYSRRVWELGEWVADTLQKLFGSGGGPSTT